MLTVVDDEQQFEWPQILDHHIVDPRALKVLHPKRRRHCVAHRGALAQWRELADPRAIGEIVALAVGRLERQPGLAHSTDAGERDNRAIAESGDHAHYIGFAANQRGWPPGHFAGGTSDRLRGRNGPREVKS